MNMLDEEESLHAKREDFNHLSNIEWNAVERMSSTVGETAVSAMLESLDRDEQHAAKPSSFKMNLSPRGRK